MATLVITDGPAAGHHFDLHKHRLVMIGRDEECTFQVLDDQVSRRHLQVKLDLDQAKHFVIDVGSANGVKLNGTKIDANAQLPLIDGDEIAVGQSKIVYTVQDFPDAEQAMRGVRILGERRRTTLVDRE